MGDVLWRGMGRDQAGQDRSVRQINPFICRIALCQSVVTATEMESVASQGLGLGRSIIYIKHTIV